MVAQAIRQWFWDCYDHLGRLLVGNLTLFLFLFPVMTLIPAFVEPLTAEGAGGTELATAYVITATLLTMFSAVWLSGLMHFAQLVSGEKDPSIRDMGRGVWLHGRRVLALLTLVALTLGLLLLNVWFYFLSGQLTGSLSLVGYVLGGFFLWMIPLLFMVLLHALPFLVRNNSTSLRSLRFGFLVTMKYPGVTFSMLLFLFSMWILGAVIQYAGIFLFAFSGTAILINSLHDVLLDTEERAERRRIANDTANEKRPSTWKELREIEDETEEEKMRRSRYERTFRDLIRPWET